jgi:hypothetical protein
VRTEQHCDATPKRTNIFGVQCTSKAADGYEDRSVERLQLLKDAGHTDRIRMLSMAVKQMAENVFNSRNVTSY